MVWSCERFYGSSNKRGVASSALDPILIFFILRARGLVCCVLFGRALRCGIQRTDEPRRGARRASSHSRRRGARHVLDCARQGKGKERRRQGRGRTPAIQLYTLDGWHWLRRLAGGSSAARGVVTFCLCTHVGCMNVAWVWPRAQCAALRTKHTHLQRECERLAAEREATTVCIGSPMSPLPISAICLYPGNHIKRSENTTQRLLRRAMRSTDKESPIRRCRIAL